MEAVRPWNAALTSMLAVVLFCISQPAAAQNARSQNFLVHAPTQELADSVAQHAEKFRNELAEYWLGKRLPNWPTPCPIEVVAGPHLAAQGATTYNRSPVGNFQMKVIGTPERILDSVLPHEVTHTVMATHFGRPLPRWADEGICTTVEHSAERNKHEIKLREYLSNRRGIAMNDLFLLTEYPQDMLPMYAQGYSVCRFLIQQSGPREFIKFLEGYMSNPRNPSWTTNVQSHYGYESLRQLQDRWLAWVAQGSGPVESFVSTRARSGSTNSNIRQVAATASDVAGSVRSGSWYQGRRDQIAAGASRSLSGQTALELNPPGQGTGSRGQTTGTRGQSMGTGGQGMGTGRQGTGTRGQSTGEQTALGQIASGAASHPSTIGGASRNVRSLGPPSVISSGHYSVAQPQREQDFGAAVPMASSARSAGVFR